MQLYLQHCVLQSKQYLDAAQSAVRQQCLIKPFTRLSNACCKRLLTASQVSSHRWGFTLTKSSKPSRLLRATTKMLHTKMVNFAQHNFCFVKMPCCTIPCCATPCHFVPCCAVLRIWRVFCVISCHLCHDVSTVESLQVGVQLGITWMNSCRL